MLLRAALLARRLRRRGAAQENKTHLPIRDLAIIEGVRENPLIGYGMVVGLAGTGDRRQTMFSTQTLANILQKMGVQIPAAAVSVKNVAAVFVTASLPPFARPGTQIDVTVSSIGDCTSLEGGTLLLAPLYAADGQVYAEAQGAVTLGGYTAGKAGTNSKQVNHPTAGRIPNGGLVERDASTSICASCPGCRCWCAIPTSAYPRDGCGHQSASWAGPWRPRSTAAGWSCKVRRQRPIPSCWRRLLSLKVEIHPRARVVVSERTGTIVMGKDVRLSAVSILHGDLSIEISTEFQVSQPAPFSNTGQTAVVPQTTVQAQGRKGQAH